MSWVSSVLFRAACVGVLAFSSVCDAKAERTPRRGADDARVRSVVYSPNDVISIIGTLGTSTMIVFGEDEKIETIAVGDSVSWKIEPNKRGNVIFLKPIEAKSVTNMNVVSDKHIYSFLLRVNSSNQALPEFVVKFRYPDEERDARLMAEARRIVSTPNRDNFQNPNANYQYFYSGDDQTKPARVFDDGVKTWFQFSGDIPSIYIVDAAKDESLANYRREGDYIVVDKVSAQWMIRSGDFATCVVNKGEGQETSPASVTGASAASNARAGRSNSPKAN